jgi:thiol:disulfide interchange protein DsbD
LVYFTGHGIVNARKMEELVWTDDKILNLLKTKFVIASLWVDDRALILSKEKQVVSEINKDTIKVYGKKQCYIQEIKFKDNKTPSFFIIDYHETVLAGPYYYCISKNDFLKFLNKGLKTYNKK